MDLKKILGHPNFSKDSIFFGAFEFFFKAY